jgi:nucleotide-binding universal stress UspA family protein
MKLNNILLVPTDFSDVCHNAIDYAVKLAHEIRFKVVIYHVINKDTHAMFKGQGEVGTAVANKLQNIIDAFKMQYEVEMEFQYESGSIFDLIHTKAQEIGANMIVLGTHGKKGMQHLFGSYALKVITQAEIPTVVLQKKKFKGINNILFPVNTFTEARQKVGYASAVATRFGSQIHLYKEKVSDPAEASRIDIITKQIAEEFKKLGVKYTVSTSEKGGESAKKLVEFAVENDMDLITIVTEPQLGTNYFNLGPWNEKIMFNEAQIPVMCINPVQQGYIYFDL